MEINFHEKTDLSLTQNRGFSLFFWFLAKKQPQGAMRYILKQGNTSEEITPSVGFLPNSANLFVKIQSSKHRQETLYSTKCIEPNRLYSLTVTFSIDYENELTDIYLYLDGILDSQISIPGEPLHNQGKMHIGKVDKNSLGFIGYVADIVMVPRVLNEREIVQISKACFINLVNNANSYNSYMLRSYEIFARKFERDKLLEKYANHIGSPISVLENLDLLNDELRDIVKKFDNENLLGSEENENYNNNNNNNNNENYTNSQNLSDNNHNSTNNNPNYIKFKDRNISVEDHKVLQKLQQFIEYDESEKAIFFRKLAMNASFIYSVLFLISEDQQNLSSKRIMNILDILRETLHMKLDNEKDLISLAKILGSCENENINITNFIKNTFYFTKILYPELNLNLVNGKEANKYKTSANFANMPTSSAGFYMRNSASYSQTGFYQQNAEPVNSVELHENFLLRSSQQFANINNKEDEDFERDFVQKSTFSIKSLYSRPKTGMRPVTSRGAGFGSSNNNNNIEDREEDYVNQNFDDFVQEMNLNNNKNNSAEKNEKENNENKENNASNTNVLSTPKLQENEGKIINNNLNINDNNNLNANSNPSAAENSHTFDAIKDNQTDLREESEKDNNLADEHYDNGFDNVSKSENNENSKSKKACNPQTENDSNLNNIPNSNSNNNINDNNNNSKLDNEKHKTEGIQKQTTEEANLKDKENNDNVNSKENVHKEYNGSKNRNELSGFVSDLNNKIIGKNFENTKDQFSDPDNLIHMKVSQNQMIDNNVQVDGNKIEEEYKEEENMDMADHEDQISVINLEAKYSDDWNMGAFELIINHCFDCHKHKTTTRHYEYVRLLIFVD